MAFGKRVFLVAAVAAISALPSFASAHCGCSHRHYFGREYYFTANQYHPVTWCDACGVVWSAKTGKPSGARERASAPPQQNCGIPYYTSWPGDEY